MSTEQSNVPKRRSSAANRRRRKQAAAVSTTAPETVQQVTTQPEAVPTETVDRHIARGEERRAAKQSSQKRGVVAKVVDTERYSGLRKFYHDTMSEIRKVNWPDRAQTRNLTILVIALSMVMGLLLGGLDFILLKLFEAVG